MCRFKCLHNGIILIVNCFNLVPQIYYYYLVNANQRLNYFYHNDFSSYLYAVFGMKYLQFTLFFFDELRIIYKLFNFNFIHLEIETKYLNI